MRLFFTLCIAVLFIPKVHAQKSEIGNWFIYFGNQGFKQRWNWHNEVQYRNFNIAGDLEQLLLRTGVGYNLTNNNNNILLGYAFIHAKPYVDGTNEKATINEHRVYQQFITRQHFGRVFLQHRYRFEQRIFSNDFRTRFRYFLALNILLNQKNIAKNAVYLSAYNEIFINGSKNLYDRNRIYGALGFGISDDIRLEAGIMSQILQNAGRSQFQIVLFNNLPFRR